MTLFLTAFTLLSDSGIAASIKRHILQKDFAVRIHQSSKLSMLYRRENTTTRHHSNNPGAEYRWTRNSKKNAAERLRQRESMRGKQQRGRDYSPLFHFLLSKIGQPWDNVFSEASRRLDTTEPVFWLVALHEHQQQDLVCIGESSFYPGLYVDSHGILQQVNPAVTTRDVPVTCRCCTHTFIGVAVAWVDETAGEG